MRRLSLCLLAAALLAACDNTIDPILEASGGDYAIYGFLDTAADTQFVRVETLRATAEQALVISDTARVISRSEGTEEVHWNPTLRTLEDGSRSLLYYSLMVPLPGREYELEVQGPGGSTIASVTVPPVPSLTTFPPTGDSATLKQVLRIENINRPLRLTMRYEVVEPEDSDTSLVTIDYGRGGNAESGDWLTDVFLARDQITTLVRLGRRVVDGEVGLVSIGIQADVLSPEWALPVGGGNISSGLGFFGAIGRYRLHWILESRYVGLMGFVDAQ